MGTVKNLDDARPHLTVTLHDGRPVVSPVSLWVGIAKGTRTVDALAELRDPMLRIVVAEWLEHVGAVGYGELREIEG